MDQNELPLDPHHVGVQSCAPKMISEPMVCLAQTVHLSCVEINTISKWTETSFHLTHITKEFNRMRQKQFLSLLQVWRKPCTYLASRLTLSLKRLKRASIWPTSPRSSIGCAQKDFHALVPSAQTVHLSCAEINTISKWTQTSIHLTHITYEFHRVRPKKFRCSWYIRRKPYTYLALRLTLSLNRPKRASNWPMSPTSSIGCAQNNFWAYCTFSANRAPVLHRV
jgi:hypothetical protein